MNHLLRIARAIRRRTWPRRLDTAVLRADNAHLFPRETWHHYDEPALPLQPFGLAMPNAALRTNAAGGGDLAMFLGIADSWAHLVSRFLPPRPTVLDLGCGCAKLARYLLIHPDLTYIGVDIFLPHILWCRRAFADYGERVRFEHFDGYSEIYNPKGSVQTRDYALPAADASVDTVVAGSLFTHLLEPDARHYLREIARVLRPGGRAIISLHVEPPAGQVYAGDHDRADVDEGYFLSMGADAGLEPDTRVGKVYGQIVHVLRRP